METHGEPRTAETRGCSATQERRKRCLVCSSWTKTLAMPWDRMGSFSGLPMALLPRLLMSRGRNWMLAPPLPCKVCLWLRTAPSTLWAGAKSIFDPPMKVPHGQACLCPSMRSTMPSHFWTITTDGSLAAKEAFTLPPTADPAGHGHAATTCLALFKWPLLANLLLKLAVPIRPLNFCSLLTAGPLAP